MNAKPNYRELPQSRDLVGLAGVRISRGFLRVRVAVFFQVYIRNAVIRLRRIVGVAGKFAMKLGRTNRRGVLKSSAVPIERFIGDGKLERTNRAFRDVHIKGVLAVECLDLEAYILHEQIIRHRKAPLCKAANALLTSREQLFAIPMIRIAGPRGRLHPRLDLHRVRLDHHAHRRLRDRLRRRDHCHHCD